MKVHDDSELTSPAPLSVLILNQGSVCASGAQTNGGEEGLAKGDGCGVRLQTVPLRTGGRKSDSTKRGGQPSHRHEVGGAFSRVLAIIDEVDRNL